MDERNLVAVSIKHTILVGSLGCRVGCGDVGQRTMKNGRSVATRSILTLLKCIRLKNGKKVDTAQAMCARPIRENCAIAICRQMKKLNRLFECCAVEVWTDGLQGICYKRSCC